MQSVDICMKYQRFSVSVNGRTSVTSLRGGIKVTEMLFIIIYADSTVVVNGNSPCFSAIG